MKNLLLLSTLLSSLYVGGQFAPPAGQVGSSALHEDSSSFNAWASSCVLHLGWQNIADTTLGKAAVGDSLSPIGKPSNTVVSLGDGGIATLQFGQYLYDGPGWDFAVFENSFQDDFLELAFVEVSSDGINFHRFQAASLTQDTQQIGPFGLLDATKINNLAGKYRGGFGTPFDLSELSGAAGLDLQKITHVRVIDVVGSILNAYASSDTADHKINDPWPTAFASSGFDLAGVGLIHSSSKVGLKEQDFNVGVYPNPSSGNINITFTESNFSIQIYSLTGKLLLEKVVSKNLNNTYPLDINFLSNGQYVLVLNHNNTQHQQLLSIVK